MRAKTVSISALVGAVVTLLVISRGSSVADIFLDGYWSVALIEGALTGALLGNVGWVFADPTQRLSLTAILAVTMNIAAWLFFLTSPVMPDPVPVDTSHDVELVTGMPVMLAGRASGTHGVENTADRLLHFSAGPAAGFGQMVVALATNSFENRGASWAAAAIGFVVSNAFWITAGNAIAVWRMRRRVRRERRSSAKTAT